MDETPTTDDVSVVRSEERLNVSTRPVEIGRAVFRKRIVVEERTVTVRVAHEEVELEIVPFDEPIRVDEQRGGAHLALPEFVLHREEIVVTKRIVPVERVRLRVSAVTEQQQVTADLRQERVEFDSGLPQTSGPSASA